MQRGWKRAGRVERGHSRSVVRAGVAALVLALAASVLAGAATAPAEAAGSSATPDYAPFSSWPALVTQVFQDVVNRKPTSAESTAWTKELSTQASRKGDFADALRRSAENTANVDPVVRVYRAFLGRAPDAGGLKYWISRKRNVKPAKTWSVTQIAEYFTRSSEFQRKYGKLTNRQFVTQIYTDVLGRAADPDGVDFWTKQLDTKARSKAQIVVGFSESNEYKRKQAENTDVAVAYVFLVGRAPFPAETAAWTDREKAGTSNATLLDELLGGTTYFTKVGAPVPVVPGAPTVVTASAGNAQATVSWTAPASDGGAPISGYTVTPYIGDVAQPAISFESSATKRVVAGLRNGTAYSFSVAATNGAGTGTASARSGSVTPVAPLGIVQVGAGASHSCARYQSGAVRCWGDGSSGALGNGTTDSSSTPVVVPGITTAVDLSTGPRKNCAVLASGAVTCWGTASRDEIGDSVETQLAPTAVSGITTATSVAVGGDHACAVLAAGTVRCWGLGVSGQLGDGVNRTYTSAPVTVSGLTSVVSVSAGAGNTCALLGSGLVRCWGSNASGESGGGSGVDRVPVPTVVKGISSAMSVSASDSSSCALLRSGRVRCWGGSAASGTTEQMAGISDAAQLDRDCAVRVSGAVACWGWNVYGRVGNGTYDPVDAPVDVSGLTASTVTSRDGHTCAVASAGGVLCWGDNTDGQLGNGYSTTADGPVAVVSLTGAASIATGDDHSCAVRANGTVACWGANGDGALGNGTNVGSAVPVPVTGITQAVAVTAGRSFTCALLSTGAVRCWGAGSAGQLGNGKTVSSSTPVTVSGVASATKVVAGFDHACALIANGAVRCWGSNGNGELGDGTTTDRAVPVAVSGLTGAVDVAAGGGETPGQLGTVQPWSHSCAALAGGSVKCWGSNDAGQLGRTGGDAKVPVTATAVADAASLSAGRGFTCARRAGATVSCWGANAEDDMFYGGVLGSPTPTAIPGVTGATQVAAGSGGACALVAGGSVRCWPLDDRDHPAAVSGITSATAVAQGGSHACALLADATVRCWGSRADGQLGDGLGTSSPVPVQVIGL